MSFLCADELPEVFEAPCFENKQIFQDVNFLNSEFRIQYLEQTRFCIFRAKDRSLFLMFFHKSSDVLLMHIVVLVLLPFKGRSHKHLISPCGSTDVFLDFEIVVAQSWYLSSLPWQMTNEKLELLNHPNRMPMIDVCIMASFGLAELLVRGSC